MKYLLMIVLLFSFGQARAELDGSLLLEFCEAYIKDASDAKTVVKANVCGGYVEGITEIHTTFVGWNELKPYWCSPDNMGTVQLVRVVAKYLQENPEQLHFSASSIVATALRGAFPCE